MKMSFTAVEEKIYEDKVNSMMDTNIDLPQWAKDSFSSDEFILVLIKTLNNLLPGYSQPNKGNLSDSEILKNHELAKNLLHELLLKAIKTNQAADTIKEMLVEKEAIRPSLEAYTSSQMAKVFNVSVTTINNWVNEGRFIGITRKHNKHARILPDTLYQPPAGQPYPVKYAVEAFEEDQKEWEEKKKNSVSEHKQIKAYNDHFEKKYGGTYQEVFGSKDWNDMTSEEETDASIWSFFLERMSTNDEWK